MRGTDQDRIEIDCGNGTGMRLAGRCLRVKAVDPPANRVPLRLPVDLLNLHH